MRLKTATGGHARMATAKVAPQRIGAHSVGFEPPAIPITTWGRGTETFRPRSGFKTGNTHYLDQDAGLIPTCSKSVASGATLRRLGAPGRTSLRGPGHTLQPILSCQALLFSLYSPQMRSSLPFWISSAISKQWLSTKPGQAILTH